MFALVIRFTPVSTTRDLFAFGDGERSLYAVVAHAVGVLNDERVDVPSEET